MTIILGKSRLATVRKTGHMHLKTRATHTPTKWLTTDLDFPPRQSSKNTRLENCFGSDLVDVWCVEGCRERSKASQQTMPRQPTAPSETTSHQLSKQLHFNTHTHTHALVCARIQRMPHTAQSALDKFYLGAASARLPTLLARSSEPH